MGLPIATEFSWFYSIKSNKNDEGFYYFAKRPTKGLQAIIKIKDNMGPWNESYFYILEVQLRGTFDKACE